MLNELYELSKSLEHYGLLESRTHADVKKVGQVLCLLIEIDKKGLPREARLLQKDDTAALWKHSHGNKDSFPAIRIQKPLLAVTESAKISHYDWEKSTLSEKIKALQTLNPDAINIESSGVKISTWSLKEFSDVLDSSTQELAALKQLIGVFPNTAGGVDFSKKLVKFLFEKSVTINNENELDFIKNLLVGSLDNQSGEYKSGCMTYYDVYETADFSNLVGSLATQRALIKLLNNRNERQIENSVQAGTSALSGKRCTIIREKYPNPDIPLLGSTYLYSKKADTLCLMRYQMSGAEAFQAGENEVAALNDAITFLTDENRENKSWKKMSDSNRGQPNLLLAYLPDDPQNDAYLARILGEFSDDASKDELREETESAFDNLCQQVLKNMESLIRKNPQSKIQLILLEKLDPGRRQVVYENALSVEQFRTNLILWSEAAKNQASIEIRVYDKKGITHYTPDCPGPNDICQLLKMNYTRSGSSKPMKQSAVSLHDIYQLYMPPNDFVVHDDVFHYDVMRKVLKTTGQLIIDVGHMQILAYALPSEKASRTKAKDVTRSVALMSILLWRLGVRKEIYTMNAPFNVGQFLQLTDMLHKEYCIQVRNSGNKKETLPAQLIGNEMLVIASENPVEGLNRLRDRMKIYLAWANTATGEGTRLAKWILARYGEVSEKIAEDHLPEQFNPAEQAQVLLGYLASIPYEKKNNGEAQSNE